MHQLMKDHHNQEEEFATEHDEWEKEAKIYGSHECRYKI